MWASEGYLHIPIRNVSSANLRQPARGNSSFSSVFDRSAFLFGVSDWKGTERYTFREAP